MDKKSLSGKVIAGIVILVIVIALIIFFYFLHNPAQKSAAPGASLTNTNIASGTAALTTPSSTNVSSSGGGALASNSLNATPVVPPPPVIITLTSPVVNNQWTIGTSNTISWNNPPGITGQIELLDENTQAMVGVILSEIGPNQTSYAWDTRDIYLDRYGALKKDVVPGTYNIRLQFDGNNLPDVVSAPFIVTN